MPKSAEGFCRCPCWPNLPQLARHHVHTNWVLMQPPQRTKRRLKRGLNAGLVRFDSLSCHALCEMDVPTSTFMLRCLYHNPQRRKAASHGWEFPELHKGFGMLMSQIGLAKSEHNNQDLGFAVGEAIHDTHHFDYPARCPSTCNTDSCLPSEATTLLSLPLSLS